MIKILLFVLLSIGVLSCDSKFDKARWMKKGDLGSYPNRRKMLKELLQNHKLIGLSYHQLVEKIGEPDSVAVELNSIYYNIITEYDTHPVYTRDLTLKLNKDSVVTDLKVSTKGQSKWL